MSDRILVAMQMYAGDKDAAFSALKLIADIAPNGRYQEADLLIAVRLDCPFDHASIPYVARAFNNTWTFRSTNRKTGWPEGCNGISSDTYRYYVSRQKNHRWDYSGILLLESDCVPTCRDWLTRLVAEWKSCGKPILGYLRPTEDGTPDHCNAVAILNPELTRMEPGFIRCSPACGWDWGHRAFMVANAAASREIFMDYRTPETNCDVLFAPRSYSGKHPLAGKAPHQPALLHGPKNWQQVHANIRERLLGVPALA